MDFYEKIYRTVRLCFYYLFLLAAAESMIWLEKSSIIILTFVGIHTITTVYEWIDHFANISGKNLHPYRNLSNSLKTCLKISDFFVTIVVIMGFLFIEIREENTDDFYYYLLCFLCFFIVIPNIILFQKRHAENNSVFTYV